MRVCVRVRVCPQDMINAASAGKNRQPIPGDRDHVSRQRAAGTLVSVAALSGLNALMRRGAHTRPTGDQVRHIHTHTDTRRHTALPLTCKWVPAVFLLHVLQSIACICACETCWRPGWSKQHKQCGPAFACVFCVRVLVSCRLLTRCCVWPMPS